MQISHVMSQLVDLLLRRHDAAFLSPAARGSSSNQTNAEGLSVSKTRVLQWESSGMAPRGMGIKMKIA